MKGNFAETTIGQILLGPQNTLTNIQRYPLMRKNRHESVAEHSYCVIVIADNIARDIANRFPEKKIDFANVMRFAAYHDFAEAFTGDLPTWYKYEDEKTREAIEKLDKTLTERGLEKSFAGNKHIIDNISLAMDDYEKEKTTKLENRIVKFADTLQGISYCVSEINSGNVNFSEILEIHIKSMIDKYGRSKIFKKYIIDILTEITTRGLTLNQASGIDVAQFASLVESDD